ncbi:MAG: putative CopG family antitoxin [Oleiphilaceae bacterium]|jgi:predicted CopG family antitoxin
MKTIEISESVYDRLAKKVIGFGDTPSLVIERMLDEIEGASVKPSLTFSPEDESDFKKLLLRDKVAEVALYKKNGEIEILVWNASKLKESSNIKANIWSGYLRNWEEKGIIKAEFSIYGRPVDAFRDHKFFDLCKALSPLINVPYKNLIECDFSHLIEARDGENVLEIQFSDGQDLDLLTSNEYFESSTKRITIPQHCLNYPL